jgi:DNA-binding PadR family transcriptional regulator
MPAIRGCLGWVTKMPRHGGTYGGGRDGRRIRRGAVPGLLLAALLDGPAHGYQLMDRLEALSGGNWRPSPGSVYPLLQSFEDQGLVEHQESPGRRVFALTDVGRAHALRRRADTDSPAFPVDPHHSQLRTEVEQLRAAARQLGSVATSEEELDAAAAIVRTARRALYRLLAER